jgi:hypothetical protein
MGAQQKSAFSISEFGVSAEFVVDAKKREGQLIARIYRLSHLLSNGDLDPEQEEQIKLILEDALAELDILNEQSNMEVSVNKILFH